MVKRKVNLDDLSVANLAAAELEIDRLIAEADESSSFGVIRIELEPNSQMVRLPAAEFARLKTEITRTLLPLLRHDDKLFTNQGWTWLVVLPNLISTTHLTLALMRLQQGIDQRKGMTALQHLPIMPILGGAFYPDSAGDAHGMMAMARLASFEAWRAGERYRIGMASEETEVGRHLDLVKRVPLALQKDQLQIHLQPQVLAKTGGCAAVEVLLRWHDGDNGWIAPPLIIAAIEQAGIRQAFNRWLLQRTVRCLKGLDALGVAVNFSINLVAADVHDPELADVINQVLLTWNVDSSRVAFEITETAMVHESLETQQNLQRLKSLGVRLSLDDFGTAYSTMAYLRNMPIDELKIDQSFVQRMTESEKDREIVTSIINLAHQLNIKVVAEGVEREETLDALRNLGCDLIQGYFYSKPLAPKDFALWWKNRLAPETPQPA